MAIYWLIEAGIHRPYSTLSMENIDTPQSLDPIHRERLDKTRQRQPVQVLHNFVG